MKWIKLFSLLCFSFSLSISHAQSTHRLLRKGDEAYKSQEFSQAEENYRKALEKKAGPEGAFNLGNSITQQT